MPLSYLLWFSSDGGGVARYDGRTFTTFTTADGLADNRVEPILEDRQGHLWFGTGGYVGSSMGLGAGVSRYDGHTFTTFSTADGLAGNNVRAIVQDRSGHLWFGTASGVSRYDGQSFVNFTSRDGLASNYVEEIVEDSRGQLWFGTANGVSRYDGRDFTIFKPTSGMWIDSILEDRQGRLWFGTSRNGASCWDGETFTTYAEADGLPEGVIFDLAEDTAGDLWLASMPFGLSRYDGRTFETFTTDDGLGNDQTLSLFEDRTGHLWVGTFGTGVSRYDGARFVTFTTEDGLADNRVASIREDRQGHLWFGITKGGVTRYDGKTFATFDHNNGLSGTLVISIHEDRQGHLWFGLFGGGVTRYDGRVFQHLSRRDGLTSEAVQEIIEDRQGRIWIATEGGLTRYRLQGRDEDWQQTRQTEVKYERLPRGEYVFEVVAVDRDLNYSTPALIQVQVRRPYERLGLWGALGLAVLLIGWQSRRVVRRDRQLRTTNQSLQETNVELAESNRAKSRFLANMSHEIRTPMNAILGYAQILRRRPDLTEGQQPAVETIQRSGDHLLTLINEVLDISKIEAGHMELQVEDFDLHAQLAGLDTVFQLRCRELGLAWRFEGATKEALWVQGDEGKLSQVLINLLSNAVKFTAEGEVALEMHRVEEDVYRFAVRDTGPGISAADQENLFEEFRQGVAGRESGGTGLGLALARRYVGLMGGELALESAVGQGSTFSVVLSLPAGEGQKQEESGRWDQVQQLAPGHAVRALIADDVAENRQVLRSLLEDIGVEVQTVADGQQALTALEQRLPDIVFMDIRMPVMDGRQALKRIRAQADWAGLKTVAISASTLDHQRQAVLDGGFDAFIGKPFHFGVVCRALAELLEVKFIYEGGEQDESQSEKDWRDITAPAELVERLLDAVEFRQVTQMEECFQDLEQLGEKQSHLAHYLRGLRQQHRMDDISSIVEGLDRS